MNKGKHCTVEPIRKRKEIQSIKDVLADNPRNLALFTVGIHAGLRSSDLLALRWCDVLNEDGQIRKVIEVKENKTGKLRRIAISPNMRAALSSWLAVCSKRQTNPLQPGDLTREDLLFPSNAIDTNQPLTIQRLHQLVNEWTAKAGIQGHFGGYTLRKTYGYHLRKKGTDLPTLMKIFGHSSPWITLRYLGIDNDEIDEANLKLNL